MGEGAEGGMGEGESDVAAGGIQTTSDFEEKGFSCRTKKKCWKSTTQGVEG
jgi:hypothetical protein